MNNEIPTLNIKDQPKSIEGGPDQVEGEPTIISEEIRPYKVLGDYDNQLLEENNIYCDLNELIKFEEKAMQNHNQTFEQMARRGGLTIHEIYALVTGTTYSVSAKMDRLEMTKYLLGEDIFKQLDKQG